MQPLRFIVIIEVLKTSVKSLESVYYGVKIQVSGQQASLKTNLAGQFPNISVKFL